MRNVFALLFAWLFVQPVLAQDQPSPVPTPTASAIDPEAQHEPETELILGWLRESSRDPTFAYGLAYTSIRHGAFKFQYEVFDTPVGYQRFWANYALKITESEDFVLVIKPGIGISNQKDFLIGADLDVSFPAYRIQIQPRIYRGNNYDQVYVLSLWQPIESEDQLLVFHFWDINSEFPSTSYVGLAANLFDGGLLIGVGPSLTKNADYFTAVQGTFRW